MGPRETAKGAGADTKPAKITATRRPAKGDRVLVRYAVNGQAYAETEAKVAAVHEDGSVDIESPALERVPAWTKDAKGHCWKPAPASKPAAAEQD